MTEERIAETSPRSLARMAGIFEALEGLTAAYGQVVVLGRLVTGDAAATAANILNHQSSFWLGYISSVIGVGCHIIWVTLFYFLFRPVSRRLALLTAFIGVLVCAIQALTALLYLSPLAALQGGERLASLTTGQLQALAVVLLRLNGYAFDLDLVCFGLWCLLTGYLILKSTFLPRILGVLLAIDGLGWMMYVSPPFAAHLFPLIAAASAVAELPIQVWLIVRGVNPERWKQQALAAGW